MGTMPDFIDGMKKEIEFIDCDLSTIIFDIESIKVTLGNLESEKTKLLDKRHKIAAALDVLEGKAQTMDSYLSAPKNIPEPAKKPEVIEGVILEPGFRLALVNGEKILVPETLQSVSTNFTCPPPLPAFMDSGFGSDGPNG